MKKVKVMMLLVVALFISVGSGLVARAQDSSTRGASGLSISPPKFEFTIERGKAELATIQVKNVTDDIVLAKAFLNDFEADGTTGNPKLIVDSKNQESTSLKEFVVGLDDITIQPGETVEVKVPIQIPEDAAPGAYYGAIRFLGTPPEETNVDSTTQLSLNASVAAIVLVEVPGDVTEKIEVKNISAYLTTKREACSPRSLLKWVLKSITLATASRSHSVRLQSLDLGAKAKFIHMSLTTRLHGEISYQILRECLKTTLVALTCQDAIQ